MELPWSNYLYAVATLAMTFIGFCAIVISLHQTRNGRSPNITILRQHTRGYGVFVLTYEDFPESA
jgi:VIT1/CCC1 family predicted Fe2+/Mn2+ transporter